MHQTGATKAYIDDIGSGAGSVDKARRMGLPVVAVNFASRATQRKRFANLRAECYWTVRELLREGKMSLPNDPMLVADLTAPKYAPDPYGRILIESKDDIRARLGRSPDAGDGLALSYAVPITEASEELENQQREMITGRKLDFQGDRVREGFSKDAALLVTLQPGAYSAQVSGVNGTTGVALVEVYDVP